MRITKEAKDFIIHNGYDPRFGVRDLRSTVERLIQVPLSNLILSNKIMGQSSWAVDCKNGDVVIIPEWIFFLKDEEREEHTTMA